MPPDFIDSLETIGFWFDEVIKSLFFDKIKLFTDVHCVNSLDVKQLFYKRKNVYYENDNSNATIM